MEDSILSSFRRKREANYGREDKGTACTCRQDELASGVDKFGFVFLNTIFPLLNLIFHFLVCCIFVFVYTVFGIWIF